MTRAARKFPGDTGIVVATTLSLPSGTASDYFGQSVATDGTRIIVGAPFRDTTAGTDSGAAYIYEWGGTWTRHELIPSTIENNQRFGASVDIDGDIAVIGAPDASSTHGPGVAFVFRRQSNGTWTQDAKLEPTLDTPASRFGENVACEHDRALVTPWATADAAYLYRYDGSQWNRDDTVDARFSALLDREAIQGRGPMYTPAAGPGRSFSATYDQLGNWTSHSLDDHTDWAAIASAKRGTSSNHDASSSVTRHYNGLMRLTRESQAIEEDPARHVDYAYDLPGNVTQLNYPGGTTIATTYDANHRRDVIDKDASQIADYDYVGPGNRPRKLTFETGVTDVVQTHSYDGAGRLTRLSQAQGSTELATFGYAFDDAGNILTRTFEHRSGTPSEDYAHDSLHRLTRTTFGQRDAGGSDPYKGWTYDDLGNHLTQDDDGTTTAGLYNAVNEQTARGGTGLTWSRTGNLTEDDAPGGGQQYSYDRDNMLTRVEDASNNLVEEYTYDALGRRIVAGDGTNDKRFYYSIHFQILEQTDASDVVQKAFVWGNYIDELLLMEDTAGDGGTAGADCFALRHHHYNVVALIDDTGTVVERYDYNPYGQRVDRDADFTDDADGASDYLNPIGHQGLHHDDETSLVYNRARMLNPTLGRFMQRDPLGYVDGMSVYKYVNSRPIMFIDPSGEEACCKDNRPVQDVLLDGFEKG